MIALPVDDESISEASARAQSGLICGFARVRLRPSMRVLVRPIGLDMVEVASSNLAGPTKYDRPGLVPGFSYLAQR